jgi:hypothetical protein
MKAIYTLTLTLVLGLAILLIGFYSLPAVGAQDRGPVTPMEPQIIGPEPPFEMGRQFVHRVTDGNRFGCDTYIDNSFTNSHPNEVIIATSNWNPAGGGGGYNDHTIGLYYLGTQWAIFNQDLLTPTLGAAFNVLNPPPYSDMFIQVTKDINTTGNSTYIDDIFTNNHPEAIILVTPNANPGGGYGAFDDKRIGVWYSDYYDQWAIFNQDSSNMTLNIAFNVLVGPIDPGVFVHKATVTNTGGNLTCIDNPLTNNRPNALVYVTPNWNPGGGAGTYHDHNIGVYYSTGHKWCIFNQDYTVDMTIGAAFNVLVSSNSLYTPAVMKSP